MRFRIDFIPNIRVSDLNSAKARKIVDADKAGIIRTDICTITYTRSLYIRVFLRRSSDISRTLNKLQPIIHKLKKNLNTCKPTKVKTFVSKLVNIQGQGNFERKIDLYLFDQIGAPLGYKLYHIEQNHKHAIPTERPLQEINISCVKLVHGSSNIIQIYFSGSFSLVAKNLNALNILTESLLFLDTQ